MYFVIVGTTNQTAKSVLGLLDPVSAAINIILGELSLTGSKGYSRKNKITEIRLCLFMKG